MNLLKKIIPKDSFYLILFICVGVLGASAVWVSKEKMDTPEKLEAKEKIVEQEIKLDLREENVSKERVKNSKKEITVDKKPTQVKDNAEKSTVKNEPKQESKVEEKPIEKQQVLAEPKVNTEQSQEQQQSEAVASGQAEVIKLKLKLKQPVEGKVYKDFANDKLVYSKTLEEWSVHLGIDIAAKEGTDVKAALDGIVKAVDKDGKLGITIILDHGNGLETVYKNISTEKMVKVGQKVKSGQVISKVSRGIGFEKLDEPHLHFEVLESGVRVDPKRFFEN